ncbi:hypothetical protein E4U41_004826, partial [Claviceps citrina]
MSRRGNSTHCMFVLTDCFLLTTAIAIATAMPLPSPPPSIAQSLSETAGPSTYSSVELSSKIKAGPPVP